MIRHFWIVVPVLLAASALAVAGYGSAQEGNGFSDGIYAAPDAGQSPSAGLAAAGRPSGSSGPMIYEAAGGRVDSAAWKPNRAEPLWIGILAGVGILVSLAGVGLIWRSRTRASARDAVILAVPREPAAAPDRLDEQAAPSRRCAA